MKIVNARLAERVGEWYIETTAGKITAIYNAQACNNWESSGGTVPVLDAGGHLLIPALVDAHFHLDKALILQRSPAHTGTFTEALQETSRLKQSFTVTDIQQRARRVLERAIAPGNPADFVLLAAESVTEAIATTPTQRTVIKNGQIIAQTQVHQTFGNRH